jgi:hypothetical protein
MSAKTIEELREAYGAKKIIPRQFEQAALVALSHYPELKNLHVEFVITEKALFPYASRPKLTDIFLPPLKRRYHIVIADQSKSLEMVLLKNLPFEAQVGILGHELAHTVCYIGKNTLGVLKTGFWYFWPRFRERFEKDTDRAAIAHGLGKELYSYSIYIRSVEGILKSNNWIDRYYLKPVEILEEIAIVERINDHKF